MEVRIKEEGKSEIEYPCLMKYLYSDLVVLFTDNGKGTVVKSDKGKSLTWKPLGEYREDWILWNFRSFQGTLELSN